MRFRQLHQCMRAVYFVKNMVLLSIFDPCYYCYSVTVRPLIHTQTVKILKHIEMLTVMIKLLNDKCALTDVLLAISFSSFLEIRRTSSSQPIMTPFQSVTERKTLKVTNDSLWWIYASLEPEWQIVITGENWPPKL